MSEEKTYIYSYASLKQELVEKRRFGGFSKYASCTELEWLCKQHLHTECARHEDVEWKKLNVTAQILPNIIKWIDNDYESVRLLVYFSDHSRDILDDDDIFPISDSTYEHFEKECSRHINRLYKNHKSQQGTPDFLSGETYPSMERIGMKKYPMQKIDTLGKPYISVYYMGYKAEKIPMQDALIKPFLPKTNDGGGLFEDSDVFNAVMYIRALTDIQFQQSQNHLEIVGAKICDINELIKFVKARITAAANRMLWGRTQPVLQALFVLAVYWSIDDYVPAYSPYFRESAKIIKQYLSEQRVPLSKIEQCANDVEKAREEKPTPSKSNTQDTSSDDVVDLTNSHDFLKLIIADDPNLVLRELHRRIDGRKGKDIGVVLGAAAYKYKVLSRTPHKNEFEIEFPNIQKCSWRSISEWLKKPLTEKDLRPDIKDVILNFEDN